MARKVSIDGTEYLTPGEVALLLRVDPKSVTRWAQRGLVPCFKTPGGHRRYLRADVEKILANGGRLNGRAS